MTATSFRDPAGHVVVTDDGVYRFVDESVANELRAFLTLNVTCELVKEGSLIATSEADRSTPAIVDVAEGDLSGVVFRHERLPFISYPYEWCPNMLASAAELTLRIAARTLDSGWGLKDATPYNVLFRGADPVFVDILSFERRDPNDPIWLPYGQFTRTFLIPLLMNRRFALPLASMLLTNRDGVRPSEAVLMFTRPARYLPPTLGLVTIPAALERKAVGSIRRRQHDAGRVGDPRKSRFIIQSLFARALKQLRRVTPFTDLTSTWTGYVDAHHTPAYHDAKRRIVEDFLRTHTPSRVLDIGCNTGDYSVLAARCGARVVAVDSDEAVISRLWHRARKERADILPLVVNIARPSPAVGWLNRECYSFLERAEGVFDTVLMLALVHHLLVTERIPFEQIIRLAARLTSRFCVIEFVPSDDPKFQELTGGWNELYTHWTHDLFRQHCARYFETVAEVPLRDSDRWLHLLAKRTA